MPGENCSIFGCSVSRRNKAFSLFKLPTAKDDLHKEWRKDILTIITRDRVADKDFLEREKNDRIYICEKHFLPDDFYYYATKKTLKIGSLPTKNLPKKSIETKEKEKRSTSVIEKRASLPLPITVKGKEEAKKYYKGFDEFKTRIFKLTLPAGWKILDQNEYICVTRAVEDYFSPIYEIYVPKSLTYTVRYFEWLVPTEHPLYSTYVSSFFNITLTNFIHVLSQQKSCKGILDPSIQNTADIYPHVVYKKFDFINYCRTNIDSQRTIYYRSKSCSVLLISTSSEEVCASCKKMASKKKAKSSYQKKKLMEPVKAKAPLTLTSPERLKVTIQASRLKCNQLAAQLKEMKDALSEVSTEIDSGLAEDMKLLYSGATTDSIPPFMKFFWEEQQKYLNVSGAKGLRYHPMIIKFCLGLAAKSPAAYEQLRLNKEEGSGILVLPSQRTLRDYRNYISPTRGFNSKYINELQMKFSSFSSIEKYMVMALDEMKVQEDLVWDKNSGELIGFVDLGDTETNILNLKNSQELASYVLVFLLKSMANPMCINFATFATTGVTSSQIYTLFWKATAILEMTCKVRLIAVVADGASPNRKFFKIHKMNNDTDVTHFAQNVFADDERNIYFFADAPHLMKTVRNSLANSGAGKCTRYLWNDGYYLLWSHISQLYYENLNFGLKLLPKLKFEHVSLTPYSVMNVKLAVQILSESVGKYLIDIGQPETHGTGRLCLMMDKFFDALNVRNTKEHVEKRKDFLKPYKSKDDMRFEWLDEFLQYLQSWQDSVDSRPGNFSKQNREAMFLPWQTFEGLKITVRSLKAVIPYLLDHGFRYVLSEKFCQDQLENYFGKQRSIGRRKDNPSVRDVGYNDNIIKSQFSIQTTTGNSRADRSHKWDAIDDTPLPKKRRKR